MKQSQSLSVEGCVAEGWLYLRNSDGKVAALDLARVRWSSQSVVGLIDRIMMGVMRIEVPATSEFAWLSEYASRMEISTDVADVGSGSFVEYAPVGQRRCEVEIEYAINPALAPRKPEQTSMYGYGAEWVPMVPRVNRDAIIRYGAPDSPEARLAPKRAGVSDPMPERTRRFLADGEDL